MRNSDPINSPSHYTQGEIQCIDAIKAQMSREEYMGFLRGNLIKYTWRCRHKNGVEDAQKANWYLTRIIEEWKEDDAVS